MKLHLLRTLLAGALWLSVTPAAGQSDEEMLRNLSRPRTPYAWDFVGFNAQFDQPTYLARCTGPCPGDGLMLVPNPESYRPGVLQVLGGPYRQRLDVEMDRNRLVAAGLAAYSLRLHIFDEYGEEEVGAFWLGAKPGCSTPELARGAVVGDIRADFGPRPPGLPPLGRPEAFPVPFDWDDYEREVRSMREICEERARNARPGPG